MLENYFDDKLRWSGSQTGLQTREGQYLFVFKIFPVHILLLFTLGMTMESVEQVS